MVRAVAFDNADEAEVLTQMLVVRAAPFDAAITKEAIESPSLDYTPKGLGIKTQTERVCNVMQQVLSRPWNLDTFSKVAKALLQVPHIETTFAHDLGVLQHAASPFKFS